MTNRCLLYMCLLLLSALLGACSKKEEPASDIYESTSVATRDIDISVEAAGIIEPETTIEVKSKASGEILALNADTGDHVEQGVLLVQIDKRSPVNILDQSRADLEAARARRKIATTQLNRTRSLLDKGIVTETEYETAELELANAEAAVISRQVELENAQIALDDTDVKAPISGIVIEKNVERGQVISSPTRDVGGGTVLLKMADLATVQVRTRVDETDIGKIEPGMEAIVKVSAYPNQPFNGQVLKIEPQATVDQNVTMFPVLIRLENQKGLLRPGMNAEVIINIAHAENVLAVPTMALRTDRDLATTAAVLQISTDELKQKIAASRTSLLKTGQSSDAIYGGEYWVLLVRDNDLEPRFVKTGITDLEYSEIISGLEKDEQVLILPSSGLLERQERIQNSLNQRLRPPGM